MLMSSLDAFFTLQLLERGAYEANPVMAAVMERGTTSFAASKMALTGFGILALVFLARSMFFNRLRTGVILTAFFSFYAVLICYEFVNLIDDLVERDLPITMVLRYLEFRSPWILAQIMPISCLVATMLAFGVMSRFNEVTATNIITLQKTVVPTTVVASGIVTYTITLTNTGNGIATVTLTDALHPDFSPNTFNTTVVVPGRTLWNTSGVTTVSFTATAPLAPGTYYNQLITATYDITETTLANTAPVTVNVALVDFSSLNYSVDEDAGPAHGRT